MSLSFFFFQKIVGFGSTNVFLLALYSRITSEGFSNPMWYQELNHGQPHVRLDPDPSSDLCTGSGVQASVREADPLEHHEIRNKFLPIPCSQLREILGK